MEDSTTETTRASVDKKIDSFVEGDLEHATEMLSALWEIANKDGDVKAPSNTPRCESVPVLPSSWRHAGVLTSHHQTAQVTSPAHWASVKIALIKSIRKGVFFDRKYWARHSKAGDVLKPVYFSSIIMGDKAQQLNKCASKFGYGFAEALRIPVVKYLKGRNALINDLEGDVNVESDCEGDSTGAGMKHRREEKEEQTRAVLITGSFSAYVHFLACHAERNDEFSSWKSLFFYRCTDVISFAPLKSQGVDSRLNHIREKTVAAAPPPCSPKSIYVLASLVRQPSIERLTHDTNTSKFKLGIQPLCDSAFADIKSKVSLDNVVDEVFSWVTARWVPSDLEPRRSTSG
jgi:hypothetical protein